MKSRWLAPVTLVAAAPSFGADVYLTEAQAVQSIFPEATSNTRRLDGLGLEAKVIYATCLVLAMPGVASMAALSFFRIGATPSAVARYYRGSDDEMQFPKNFWQMDETT